MRLTPSRVRYWKRYQPTDLRSAMDACLEYAREAHNLSVDHVAERMGLGTKWTLYKLVGELKMTAAQIRSFEHACGINLVTRYLASSAGLLAIDMPTGRKPGTEDLSHLQQVLLDATQALVQFYAAHAEADAVIAKVTAGLAELAWQRENVSRSAQPQLDFNSREGN